ncbi:MAG: hypothetical protein Q9221_005940 [Calogaya cf. arnoldii]
MFRVMPRSHDDRFPKLSSYPQRSTNFANPHDIHQQHTDRKKAAKAQRAEQRAAYQAQEQARIEAANGPNPYEPKLNIFIRPTEAKDLPQICVLHNYYVRTSALTGERVELGEREWRTRFDTCGAASHRRPRLCFASWPKKGPSYSASMDGRSVPSGNSNSREDPFITSKAQAVDTTEASKTRGEPNWRHDGQFDQSGNSNSCKDPLVTSKAQAVDTTEASHQGVFKRGSSRIFLAQGEGTYARLPEETSEMEFHMSDDGAGSGAGGTSLAWVWDPHSIPKPLGPMVDPQIGYSGTGNVESLVDAARRHEVLEMEATFVEWQEEPMPKAPAPTDHGLVRDISHPWPRALTDRYPSPLRQLPHRMRPAIKAQDGEAQDDEDDTMKGDGWTAARILEWMQGISPLLPLHRRQASLSAGHSRPRVGFSDHVEFIPRRLSTISSETLSSLSTIRPESLSDWQYFFSYQPRIFQPI